MSTEISTQIISFGRGKHQRPHILCEKMHKGRKDKHMAMGLMTRAKLKKKKKKEGGAIELMIDELMTELGTEHARQMKKNFVPQTSLGMCYVPVNPTSFLKHLVWIILGCALPENTDEHVLAHTHRHATTLTHPQKSRSPLELQ